MKVIDLNEQKIAEERDPIDSSLIQVAERNYGQLIIDTIDLLKLYYDFKDGRITEEECIDILINQLGNISTHLENRCVFLFKKERWRYDLKKDNREIKVIAHELFKNGLKYKDIASQVDVTEFCIKSWATRYWKKEKLQLNQNMEEGRILTVGMVQDHLKIKMQ